MYPDKQCHLYFTENFQEAVELVLRSASWCRIVQFDSALTLCNTVLPPDLLIYETTHSHHCSWEYWMLSCRRQIQAEFPEQNLWFHLLDIKWVARGVGGSLCNSRPWWLACWVAELGVDRWNIELFWQSHLCFLLSFSTFLVANSTFCFFIIVLLCVTEYVRISFLFVCMYVCACVCISNAVATVTGRVNSEWQKEWLKLLEGRIPLGENFISWDQCSKKKKKFHNSLVT